MNRRGFLSLLGAVAAAPLIAKPTLEDIERLTFKRRFFPGYTPNQFLTIEEFTREMLMMLKQNLSLALKANLAYDGPFSTPLL